MLMSEGLYKMEDVRDNRIIWSILIMTLVLLLTSCSPNDEGAYSRVHKCEMIIKKVHQ